MKIGAVSGLAAALLPPTDVDSVASAALTAVPFPLVVVDGQGIIVRVNEAWNRLAEQHAGHAMRRAYVGERYDEIARLLADRPTDALLCANALQSVLERSSTSGDAHFTTASEQGDQRWNVRIAAATVPRGGAVIVHIEQLGARDIEATIVPPDAVEGVWLLDAAGRTIFVNQRTADLLDYTASELLGQAAYLFLDHGSIAVFHAALQRLRQGEEEQIELKLRCRDGASRWVVAQIRPLAHADGVHAGASVTLQDAGASHGAEERIRLALDALQAVVAASPLAITTCDMHGRIERWNAAAARLFGWTEADAIGQILPTVPQELEDEDRRYREEALSGRLVTGRETLRHTRDGATVPVSVSISPLHERDGHTRGLVMVYDDIGPRKRAEADVLRNSRIQATAKLAGGVAHDVNNLMAGILGNAELLRDDLGSDNESRLVLDDIAEAAMRAGALAQQLLAYARSGRYQLQSVNLNQVITAALDEQVADTPRLSSVKTGLTAHLWTIDADRNQMSQLVSHLLTNAIEATESGGDISVGTRNIELTDAWAAERPGARAGRHVLLTIADRGVGMDPHTLDHAFEPFFTTRPNARGLGLAAAFGIVKSHGGYLSVETAPGDGARFDIYLPATDAVVADVAPVTPEAPTTTSVARGTERLLVVDDEPVLRDVMKKLLERMGYEVDVATGGADAIAQIEANPSRHDLVILDMRMPIVNGPTTFRRIRALVPDKRILIASGFERDEEAQALLDEGAMGFLQKPFEQIRLAAEVRRVLAVQA